MAIAGSIIVARTTPKKNSLPCHLILEKPNAHNDDDRGIKIQFDTITITVFLKYLKTLKLKTYLYPSIERKEGNNFIGIKGSELAKKPFDTKYTKGNRKNKQNNTRKKYLAHRPAIFLFLLREDIVFAIISYSSA